MIIALGAIKAVVGIAFTLYIATRKVERVEEGGIVIDYREHPEALNGVLN